MAPLLPRLRELPVASMTALPSTASRRPSRRRHPSQASPSPSPSPTARLSNSTTAAQASPFLTTCSSSSLKPVPPAPTPSPLWPRSATPLAPFPPSASWAVATLLSSFPGSIPPILPSRPQPRLSTATSSTILPCSWIPRNRLRATSV